MYNFTKLAGEYKQKGGKQKVAKGFAMMDSKRRSEIASMGGKAAHAKGTAYEFNSQTGKAAGKIGGRPRKNIVI